jgi:hypothetical protein
VAEETPSSVRDGAAEVAPTAPHARPSLPGGPGGPGRKRKRKSGPERFWDPRRARLALGAGLVLSVVFHYGIFPWSLLPQTNLEFRDVEGELSIPVDLLTEEEPAAPAPPTSDPTPETPVKPPSSTKGDEAGVDASEEIDAGEDAAPLSALLDAGPPAADAESASDGGESDASKVADAAIALGGDGGIPGANGPRDPSSLLGAAGAVQSGPPLVQLLINMEVIRANPTGAKMGPLLSAIPQWDEFMSGTHVDPVRDTDWVFISGPSLIHTERDMIWVRYSASDAVVDKAIGLVSKKYDRGGPFDAGVPGVKASLGHADRAQRVFLRPQPHLLVVCPPDFAYTAARALAGSKVSPHIRPGEAMRLTLKNPHRPMPFLPESISELRLWIIPRPDGSAEVFAEGDTPDGVEAAKAAEAVKKLVRDQNSIGVRIVTQGLLNNVEVTPDGKMVRGKLTASREQLEAILSLVAAQLGTSLPQSPAPPAPPAPQR